MDPSMTTMVAFDIETLGLKPTENHVNPLAPPITAVCLYSTHPDRQKTYIFRSSTDPTADQAKEDSMREELFAELDAAPRLCAFNGIRFDIPFMRTAWNIPDERVEAWIVKTFDVFEACKSALNQTFSLNLLLAANKMESKTGTGLYAIELAKRKEWEKLGDYCMQDTRMTFLVSAQRAIVLPIITKTEQRIVMDRSTPGLFLVW